MLGRVRYACGVQVSSVAPGGGLEDERDSWRVGCRPAGERNLAEKEDSASRCREGKVNIATEGLASWSRTVRRPEIPSSWGSRVWGLSPERMPTSVRELGRAVAWTFWRW